MTPLDLLASLLVFALVLGAAVGYAVRVTVSGAAYDSSHRPGLRAGEPPYAPGPSRIDAVGASALLGRGAMEMAYWCLAPVARACAWAGLSANGITGASLTLGAGAGVALAFGHFGVAGALGATAALGDALDGLVARETRTVSKGGALFDAAVDRYEELFFLGGLALHYRGSAAELGLVLLALAGSFMVSYGSAKAEALGVKAPRGSMRRAERAVYLCGGVLLSPIAAALAVRVELPAWIGDAPALGAVVLVAAVSNVSAVLRLRAIARAVPGARADEEAERDVAVVVPEQPVSTSRPAA